MQVRSKSPTSKAKFFWPEKQPSETDWHDIRCQIGGENDINPHNLTSGTVLWVQLVKMGGGFFFLTFFNSVFVFCMYTL